MYSLPFRVFPLRLFENLVRYADELGSLGLVVRRKTHTHTNTGSEGEKEREDDLLVY